MASTGVQLPAWVSFFSSCPREGTSPLVTAGRRSCHSFHHSPVGPVPTRPSFSQCLSSHVPPRYLACHLGQSVGESAVGPWECLTRQMATSRMEFHHRESGKRGPLEVLSVDLEFPARMPAGPLPVVVNAKRLPILCTIFNCGMNLASRGRMNSCKAKPFKWVSRVHRGGSVKGDINGTRPNAGQAGCMVHRLGRDHSPQK